MTLSTGTKLVHYEISSQIGEGGMGEVYQAKDTKLGRDVAIKVLPEEFARDHDRVARFQREAKLLASLNHPNIAAIHGLEESEGIHFLVMELIEGETLKDRIKSGPIPVEEALKLALQMAEALEAAHENGVIHRDLKPANIKVTPDGKIKILDFGLAKAYAGDQGSINLADSPTISAAATQQGVILDTAAYMSPEQARGKPVDKRADIWAFGVVLFEMLTGKSLFSGEDVTSTVARVLEREADFSTLPQMLHPRIQLMLQRCLEKDPNNRYSCISDARVDIQKVLADPSGIFSQPISTAEPRRNLRSTVTLIAAAVILTAIIVGAAVWYLRTPESPPLTFEYVLPDDQEFNLDQWGHPHFAISPDGSQFVYSTTKGLFIRTIGGEAPRHIAGSENNSQTPLFSLDGKWIVYFSPADQKLKKINVNGGRPTDLCDMASSPVGMQWRKDNTIILGIFPSGIMKISDNGGTPEPLINQESTNFPQLAFAPQILPDGENVLFTNLIDSLNKEIMIGSIESGKSDVLFPGQGGFYLPTGHILYSLEESDGEIWYVRPFDLEKLETQGKAVPLPERGYGLSVSETGTFAYVPRPTNNILSGVGDGAVNDTSTGRTLWWVNRNGNEEQIPLKPGNYRYPAISPDGGKIALTTENDGNLDIQVFDLLESMLRQLTWNNEAREHQPIWSPDGQRIIYALDNIGFTSSGPYKTNILQKASDGSGEAEPLYSSADTFLFPLSLSIDEKIIVTVVTFTGQDWGIGMLTMGEKPQHTIL